jgi:hypothetical protein
MFRAVPEFSELSFRRAHGSMVGYQLLISLLRERREQERAVCVGKTRISGVHGRHTVPVLILFNLFTLFMQDCFLGTRRSLIAIPQSSNSPHRFHGRVRISAIVDADCRVQRHLELELSSESSR